MVGHFADVHYLESNWNFETLALVNSTIDFDIPKITKQTRIIFSVNGVKNLIGSIFASPYPLLVGKGVIHLWKGSSIYERGHPFMKGVIHLWRPHGGGQAPCGRPHRKLKVESTDVILSTSHAKKLVSFITRISSLDGIKSGNFPLYKLLMVQFWINYNRILYYIVESQLWVRKVIVLAVSRERCAFHVDRFWTSTGGPGVRLMWTGRKKTWFLWMS